MEHASTIQKVNVLPILCMSLGNITTKYAENYAGSYARTDKNIF